MTDPRASALAAYLRARAASFSMAADANDASHVAQAGMALLDAAALAEGWPPSDPSLRRLSEAGLFETMPDDAVRVVETAAVRSATQRPLSGDAMTGAQILALMVASALAD
ncbi:MAG: hypothetical protein ACXV2I_01080 [Actinomycetes bacterium]